MKTHPFIGKTVSLEKLQMVDAEIYPRGKYDDEFTIAEVFLCNFECCITEKKSHHRWTRNRRQVTFAELPSRPLPGFTVDLESGGIKGLMPVPWQVDTLCALD